MRKTYISNIDIDKIENAIIDRKIEDGKTTYIISEVNTIDKYNNKSKYLYGRKYDEIPESYNNINKDGYIYDLFPYDFITPPTEENKYGNELNNATDIYKNLSKYYKTAFHTIIYDGESIRPNMLYGSDQYGTLDMDLPDNFNDYYLNYAELFNINKNLNAEVPDFETISKQHGLYDLSVYDYKKDIFIKAKPYISLDSSNFKLYDNDVLKLIPCVNGIYFVSGLENYEKPFIKLTITGNVEKQIIMFM